MSDSNSTKIALANAMKELMEQRPFSKISVGEICDHCEMNRKSFYYHFKDKFDLMKWIFYNEFISDMEEKSAAKGWELLEKICLYIEHNRLFYRNALEDHGQNPFRDYFQETVKPVVQECLNETFSDGDNPLFLRVFYTDAILVSIERWILENANLPSAEFIKQLKISITGLSLEAKKE